MISRKESSTKLVMPLFFGKDDCGSAKQMLNLALELKNSSTSGLVVKWLYDHYLQLMNNCVRYYLDGWPPQLDFGFLYFEDAQPGA